MRFVVVGQNNPENQFFNKGFSRRVTKSSLWWIMKTWPINQHFSLTSMYFIPIYMSLCLQHFNFYFCYKSKLDQQTLLLFLCLCISINLKNLWILLNTTPEKRQSLALEPPSVPTMWESRNYTPFHAVDHQTMMGPELLLTLRITFPTNHYHIG